MMTINQKIFLDLIKIYLHDDLDVEIPSNVDWNEVYKLAEMQGLVAVTWEAFQKLQQNGTIDSQKSESIQILVMKWFGMSNLNHKRYQEYQNAVRHLSQTFYHYGLKMMVMKGYGCSLNYPKPNCRPCGDIDIWMFGEQPIADDIMRKKFNVEISTDNDHHSVFQFDGFTIENHASIMDDNIHKSDRYINLLLHDIAHKSATESIIDGVSVLLPSVKFNSIHLLRHMASDFATYTTSLRHVLDWSTFVSKKSKELDWNYIHEVARKANMNKFLDALNGICVYYLGYSKELFPIVNDDIILRDRVFNDILNNEDKADIPEKNQSIFQKNQYGLYKTKRMWQNKWKYNIVYDESLLESFMTLALNRIKN